MANVLISRVFHQIWLGGKPLPPQFKKFADKWLELNPGWTMEWWTDDRVKAGEDIVNRKEFEAADKMAAKSDILRYELVWKHGGIYIDTDFEPLQPIEELLDGVNGFYG